MNFTDEKFNTTAFLLPDTQIEDLVSVIVPIFFGLIAITGFLGNCLVIFVVLANPQMRSTTNLLIVNLAIADLLFVIFCIPFTASDYMFYLWPFGEPWCCFVQYMIVATVLVSIYTLVLMSVDRFLAVVYPIRSREIRTEKITKIAIVTVWSVIIVLSVPVFFIHGLQELQDVHHRWLLCRFVENDFISWSTYHIIFMASSYLLPLIIISGLYILMITRLWRQGPGVKMSEESQRGRKRVTRLVVVVVIAFASLWLPIQVIMVLKSFDLYQADSTWSVIVQIISHVVAYSSSCINPVLYAFLSENFRKAFHKAVNCSPRYYQNCESQLPPPRRTSNARTSTTSM